MYSKVIAALGTLLACAASTAFAAPAQATTVTPAAVATVITGSAAFVANNGMGLTIACATVGGGATTPTSVGGTPNNNAGDTTTPGGVGFTVGTRPTFTNCTTSGIAPTTVTTSSASGSWYFSAETYPSGAIVGVLGLPAGAGTIDFTIAGQACHMVLNPSMVGQLVGLWTNGAGPNLTISQNQLDFTSNAACTALGVVAGSPMRVTALLTFSNAVTVAM